MSNTNSAAECTAADPAGMPGILYPESFSSNLLGTHVEMAVLAELLHKKLSRLSEHLKAMHCDISIISTDYFLCLYCTTLPSEVSWNLLPLPCRTADRHPEHDSAETACNDLSTDLSLCI